MDPARGDCTHRCVLKMPPQPTSQQRRRACHVKEGETQAIIRRQGHVNGRSRAAVEGSLFRSDMGKWRGGRRNGVLSTVSRPPSKGLKLEDVLSRR